MSPRAGLPGRIRSRFPASVREPPGRGPAARTPDPTARSLQGTGRPDPKERDDVDDGRPGRPRCPARRGARRPAPGAPLRRVLRAQAAPGRRPAVPRSSTATARPSPCACSCRTLRRRRAPACGSPRSTRSPPTRSPSSNACCAAATSCSSSRSPTATTTSRSARVTSLTPPPPRIRSSSPSSGSSASSPTRSSPARPSCSRPWCRTTTCAPSCGPPDAPHHRPSTPRRSRRSRSGPSTRSGTARRRPARVPVHDLVRAAGVRAANTINHPGNPVLVGLARRVQAALGWPQTATDPGFELLDSVHTPLEPAVRDAVDPSAPVRAAWRIGGEETVGRRGRRRAAHLVRRTPRGGPGDPGPLPRAAGLPRRILVTSATGSPVGDQRPATGGAPPESATVTSPLGARSCRAAPRSVPRVTRSPRGEPC